MKKIFIDTDVIIDYLTQRQPHNNDALLIFNFAKHSKLQLFTSSLAVCNTHYIIGRITTPKQASLLIKKLILLINVLPIDKSLVETSLNSNFKDFEDGVQNFCASNNHIDTVITRNTKDFSASKLTILTPSDFLKTFSPNPK